MESLSESISQSQEQGAKNLAGSRKAARHHLNLYLSRCPEGQFIALQTFPEADKNAFPRQHFLPWNATPKQIEAALDWADINHEQGAAIFLAQNPVTYHA